MEFLSIERTPSSTRVPASSNTRPAPTGALRTTGAFAECAALAAKRFAGNRLLEYQGDGGAIHHERRKVFEMIVDSTMMEQVPTDQLFKLSSTSSI